VTRLPYVVVWAASISPLSLDHLSASSAFSSQLLVRKGQYTGCGASMASHVVVIDSTARRAVVKVSLSKHLSDVLEEACGKLGVSASQYGLK